MPQFLLIPTLSTVRTSLLSPVVPRLQPTVVTTTVPVEVMLLVAVDVEVSMATAIHRAALVVTSPARTVAVEVLHVAEVVPRPAPLK